MMKLLVLCLGAWAAVALIGQVAAAQQTVVLVGSGSSVPAPIYALWSETFNQRGSTVKMRYLVSGTEEGIASLTHGAGDFAAGEVHLPAKEKAGVAELPSLVIGIVPIYNLPGVEKDLRFSGELLAEIYLGAVKNWNAPQIAKLNPGVALPDLPIKVVYRPGGKGSNYIFTEFLSKTSPRFRAAVGVSASPKWPVGTPAERSSDMADRVKAADGSIGYVEVQYAIKAHLATGLVENAAGKFVKATPESLAKACAAVEAPGWSNFAASLTNAPGADSYPITSFTWLYLRTSAADAKRQAALGDFLNWAYAGGQELAAREGYTELPPELRSKVIAKVASLK